MSDPTHWYTHNCEYCFAQTKINFPDDDKPDYPFCPVCGVATDDSDEDHSELNFEY